MTGLVIAKSNRGKKYLIECDQKQYVVFQITDSHKLDIGSEVMAVTGSIEAIGGHILEDEMGQRFKAEIAVITRNEVEAFHWISLSN